MHFVRESFCFVFVLWESFPVRASEGKARQEIPIVQKQKHVLSCHEFLLTRNPSLKSYFRCHSHRTETNSH